MNLTTTPQDSSRSIRNQFQFREKVEKKNKPGSRPCAAPPRRARDGDRPLARPAPGIRHGKWGSQPAARSVVGGGRGRAPAPARGRDGGGGGGGAGRTRRRRR